MKNFALYSARHGSHKGEEKRREKGKGERKGGGEVGMGAGECAPRRRKSCLHIPTLI